MIQVSEQAYSENEQARLDELARLIGGCGITLYEISKGARIKYDTLLRVLRKKPIRSETEARIKLYIKLRKDGN